MKKAILTVFAMALTTTALAGFSPVETPWNWASQGTNGEEWNLYDAAGGGHTGIMEYLYGAGNFTRIDDSGDQVWHDGSGPITLTAKYAGFNQQLGWMDLNTNTQHLIGGPISGNFGPVFGAPIMINIGSPVPFVWFDTNDGGTVYSQQILNGDLADHMVTFMVTGYMDRTNPNAPVFVAYDHARYVVAFEDGRGYPGTGDSDYNDLVMEVAFTPAVPLPAAAGLGALGMSLIGMLRRRVA